MTKEMIDESSLEAALALFCKKSDPYPSPFAPNIARELIEAYEQARIAGLPKERLEHITEAMRRFDEGKQFRSSIRELAEIAVAADDDWRRAGLPTDRVQRIAEAVSQIQVSSATMKTHEALAIANAAIAALGPEPVESVLRGAYEIIEETCPHFLTEDARGIALERIVKGGA